MYSSATFSTELEVNLTKFEGQEKEFLNSLIEQLGLGQDDIYENCIYPTVEIQFSFNSREGISLDEVEDVEFSLGKTVVDCPEFEKYPNILKMLEQACEYYIEGNYHNLVEKLRDNSY